MSRTLHNIKQQHRLQGKHTFPELVGKNEETPMEVQISNFFCHLRCKFFSDCEVFARAGGSGSSGSLWHHQVLKFDHGKKINSGVEQSYS